MITFKDGLTIGGNSPIRINCNIGCNKIEDDDTGRAEGVRCFHG